jgi:hypothetical protein
VMVMMMMVFACVSLPVDHAIECPNGFDVVPNDMRCTQFLGLHQSIMLGNTLPAMAMVSAMSGGTMNLAEQVTMFHIIVMNNLG